MRHRFTIILLAGLTISSCTKERQHVSPEPAKNNKVSPLFRYSGSDYSQHISKDSADRMVASYLASLGSDTGGDLQSLTFNADSMRSYLGNSSIATLKFSLAHKRPFINQGNYGEHMGVNAEALTFILSALDEEDDDYIYASGEYVYDLSTSERIGTDTANHMMLSYLSSINYTTNNIDLRSMTFDADTMRGFLENSNIVKLKFILAHRDTYINKGNYGQYCGTSAEGLTFVIVGLGTFGEVIYTSSNMVMEHTRPCPDFCTGSTLFTL